MQKIRNLRGQRFGRLVAHEPVAVDNWKRVLWLCDCDCGLDTIVAGSSLVQGITHSCGCLKREKRQSMPDRTTHGGKGTRLYTIWIGMKGRCYNPTDSSYRWYGSRGITVCAEWLNDFQAFHDWAISHGYRDDLSIDRIDNDKGYSPENCRWITEKKQCSNRTSNRIFTIDGVSKTLIEWCELCSINYKTVQDRLRRGWNINRALHDPVK